MLYVLELDMWQKAASSLPRPNQVQIRVKKQKLEKSIKRLERLKLLFKEKKKPLHVYQSRFIDIHHNLSLSLSPFPFGLFSRFLVRTFKPSPPPLVPPSGKEKKYQKIYIPPINGSTSQLDKMFVPNPSNKPRPIILIPCQPQLPLFAKDIKNLSSDICQIGKPGFSSCAIDVEFID